MNNRSIAWWLTQIGLPQYKQTLETEYYGLEGLLYVTDEDLKHLGINDPKHRVTILTQLQKQRQRLQPNTDLTFDPSPDLPALPRTRSVARKHSVGSTFDLLKPRHDLFRQSIVPRLRCHDDNRRSASCSLLHALEEDQEPRPPHRREKHSREIFRAGQRVLEVVSKRKSVAAFFNQVFGGRKDMDSLRKELEEELKLSTEDLRSHAWYHGQLQREGAEALLERDGDFLVRDSRSSEGDYVLSCKWRDQPMHFKIIRVVLRPKKGYSRELFQFEDDQFDNVPALVRYHVGGRRPVSHSSGAIIFHPITRNLPIRVINERQGAKTESSGPSGAPSWSGGHKRRSLSSTHMDTLQVNNSNNLLRSGSQPANLENVGRPSLQTAQSDSNLRTGDPPTCPSPGISPAPISPVFRTGSEPLLSPGSARSAHAGHPWGGSTLRGSDGQLHPRAPPKPLRISAFFPGVTPLPPRPETDPACFYDELVPQVPPSMLPKGHAARLRAEEKWKSRARLTETSFGFLEATERREDQRDEEEGGKNEEEDWRFECPQTETSSCFRLDAFRSLLLPENNRPLEQSVLHALKELFTHSDAKTTALHMLSVDCQVARITGVTEEQKRIMGVDSGLELITLPHGHQLRQDLLERHHLIALGVAVDILGCTGTVSQRAAALHKIIQLAHELRHTAGDLYAFSAVMKALGMPQVVRLEMTWRALRRNHTDSAVLFEKTLKPFIKALDLGDDSVCEGPLSLPHMVPLLRLMEGEDIGENSETGCQLLYSILQSARNTALNAREYQQHAHNLLSAGWEPVPELLEAFRTEFALRLFWGQSGAGAEQQERYEKFDMILTVLSNKLEPTEVMES
ncbi:breast cancer anti-estrogen resistance protein 3 [Chanos chanos]|uniref:Breast cancer anti-estrogen resistance protein 3 n=1 Tax=Chanos chanos TaxID=29144 RepID=A0A6J2VYM1_CHACN|nr:breast cancer anti-estrogen resistance protein 3-like [Chanos chanos]